MAAPVESERERQMREAEELLGEEKTRSFAKSLFFGRFEGELAFPYPAPPPGARAEQDAFVARVRDFMARKVDPVAIDRQARVPRETLDGLFDLGVMSMSIPKEYGGLGLSQDTYCRAMEEIGAVDAAIAVLVNAHQSIGLRSLIMFGTPEQQAEWLPKLIRGKMLAAFALTEPNAGSDAGGIETRAVPSEDGSYYTINGQKQWITNGGVAGLLTVMAKVPGTRDEKGRERITAFLVTPDMPGFEVKEVAMEKVGIRGTATARLAFHDLKVPAENIIGAPGKGLRLALTLLDFGRVTFGATCTGVARRCLEDSIRHANSRQQFGKPLAHFELVKKKIAEMAALTFAMESGTHLTAGLIDRGMEEYMVETAMLKVFASEALWQIINETIQLFGGRAYFTDQPYERMMRDARINQIGEGANDVLRTFIALVGMRDVGLALKETLDRLGPVSRLPEEMLGRLGKVAGFAKRHLPGSDHAQVPVRHKEIADLGHLAEELTRAFGQAVETQLMEHREGVLEKQYVQARIADAATELYMIAAVVARLDAELAGARTGELARDVESGRYYCQTAARRIRRSLHELGDNLDDETTALADRWLAPS